MKRASYILEIKRSSYIIVEDLRRCEGYPTELRVGDREKQGFAVKTAFDGVNSLGKVNWVARLGEYQF